MADFADLTLQLLREMRGDLQTLGNDMREVKQRLSGVEIGIAGMRRDLAYQAEVTAHQQVSFDKLADRVTRIERRLQLVDGEA